MPDLNLEKKIKLKEQAKDIFWQKIWRIDAFNRDFDKSTLNKPEEYLKELKAFANGIKKGINPISLTHQIEACQMSLDINKLIK